MPAADSRRTVAVLAFHKIGKPPSGGWDTWNYIDTAPFRAYLDELAAAGWHVISHAEFLRGLLEPAALPARPALLTFDDGYRSMLTVAAPILAEFGMPAVCFVPSQHVGGRNVWDHDTEPDEALCTFAELRELVASGVAVQSHGVSHRSFDELAPEDLRVEIEASKACLEDGLGQGVETLAYPYGAGGVDPAATARLLAGAGYAAAFVYKGGRCTVPSDTPYRLTRIPMGPDTNLGKWFRGERS